MSGMFVERGTAEWDAAWEGLRKIIVANDLGDGADLGQFNGGEGWQYMGTYDGEHQFRHRDHPVTGCREYRNVPVSDPAYIGHPSLAETEEIPF